MRLLPLVACLTACTPTTSDGDTAPAADTDTIVEHFSYDRSVTAGNPQKGFLTSYAWGEPVTDFPASLEFAYIPLSDLMDGPSSFTFETGLEPILDEASARGHQLVLRTTIDYPAQPSGLPAFLADEVSGQAYDDYGGGTSPDYEDPDLRAAMTAYIAALGAAYDGDPRIAFVQVGLLGFWGEWHTWPYTDWFPGDEVQTEVLEAYVAAFPTTHVQVRIPAVDSPNLRVGFHDDSFAYSTIGDVDWFFANLLTSAGADERWREVPIGGELRPELQDTIFEDTYTTDTYAQDFFDCVDATHASYMLNHGAFGQTYETEAELARAEEAALALGYEYTVRTVSVADGVATVAIEQTGIAPSYYPVSLALQTDEDTVLTEEISLQPGETADISFTVSGIPTADAPWQVSLQAEHLLSGQKMRLANAEGEGTTVHID